MSRECHMDDICQSELILAEGLRYGSFTLWKLIFFDTEGYKSTPILHDNTRFQVVKNKRISPFVNRTLIPRFGHLSEKFSRLLLNDSEIFFAGNSGPESL